MPERYGSIIKSISEIIDAMFNWIKWLLRIFIIPRVCSKDYDILEDFKTKLSGISYPFYGSKTIDLLTATSRNPAQDSNVKMWVYPFHHTLVEVDNCNSARHYSQYLSSFKKA